MTDWTIVWTTGLTVTGTLGGTAIGYWLAGRNEEARDQRAAEREKSLRLDAADLSHAEDRRRFELEQAQALYTVLELIAAHLLGDLLLKVEVFEAGLGPLPDATEDEKAELWRLARDLARTANMTLDRDMANTAGNVHHIMMDLFADARSAAEYSAMLKGPVRTAIDAALRACSVRFKAIYGPDVTSP